MHNYRPGVAGPGMRGEVLNVRRMLGGFACHDSQRWYRRKWKDCYSHGSLSVGCGSNVRPSSWTGLSEQKAVIGGLQLSAVPHYRFAILRVSGAICRGRVMELTFASRSSSSLKAHAIMSRESWDSSTSASIACWIAESASR